LLFGPEMAQQLPHRFISDNYDTCLYATRRRQLLPKLNEQ